MTVTVESSGDGDKSFALKEDTKETQGVRSKYSVRSRGQTSLSSLHHMGDSMSCDCERSKEVRSGV